MMQAFGGIMLLITPLHLKKSVFFTQTLKQLHFRCLYVENGDALFIFFLSAFFLFFISLLISFRGAEFCYIICYTDVGIQ